MLALLHELWQASSVSLEQWGEAACLSERNGKAKEVNSCVVLPWENPSGYQLALCWRHWASGFCRLSVCLSPQANATFVVAHKPEMITPELEPARRMGASTAHGRGSIAQDRSAWRPALPFSVMLYLGQAQPQPVLGSALAPSMGASGWACPQGDQGLFLSFIPLPGVFC